MNRHLTAIQTWMSHNPVTILPSESLFVAYNTMAENDVHRLPVVTVDNTLVGIITLSDVVQTVAFGERPVSGNPDTGSTLNGVLEALIPICRAMLCAWQIP